MLETVGVCPICGREAMLVKPVNAWFPGVNLWDKIILCPEHGWVVIHNGVGR
ncbi:MAG: hypothetical protein ACXQS2_01490 [Methermicoccaceae archaeon]